MRTFILSLLAFLLMLAPNTQAQNKSLELKVGDYSKKGLVTGLIGVVGTTDDGFYMLRAQGKGFALYGMGVGTKGLLFLDKYNNDLQAMMSIEIKDIPMTILNRAKKKSYEFFVQDINNDLWLFYSDETAGKNQLYRKRLNPESYTFEEPKLVSEHKIMEKGLDKRSTYKVIQSKDKSHIAVYSFTRNKRSSVSYAYVEIFDGELNPKWSITGTVPEYKKYGFATKSLSMYESTVLNGENKISLSNQGVLNIVSKTEMREEKNRYMHIIYAFQEDKNQPIISLLENDSKEILEVMLTHDKEGDVNVVGFYADELKSGSVDGVVFQTLNPLSLQKKTEKFIPFTAEHKEAFLVSDDNQVSGKDSKIKRRLSRGKDVDVSSRNLLRSIYTHENSSLTISSEYAYTDISTSYSTNAQGNSTTQYSTVYIYEDSKFINISVDGEINWIKNIDKKQRLQSNHILGSYEMFVDDNIHFFYNDIQNRQLKTSRIDSSGDFSTKMLAYLGKKGELEGFWLIPSMTTKLRDDTYIAMAMKLFKHRLLKFEFK